MTPAFTFNGHLAALIKETSKRLADIDRELESLGCSADIMKKLNERKRYEILLISLKNFNA